MILKDISGPACDVYLQIDYAYSGNEVAYTWFYRSEVQVDIPTSGAPLSFEVNKVVTDFGKPYTLHFKEHKFIRPDDYNFDCPYAGNLADYLKTVDGQASIFQYGDATLVGGLPLAAMLPSYPLDTVSHQFNEYTPPVKLYLEWLY